MCDAIGWENQENPSQPVTCHHGFRDVLEHKDDDDEESTRHEVQEKGRNLRVYVRLEDERSDIGVGHNRNWVEQEEEPDAVVVLVEDIGEHDDK